MKSINLTSSHNSDKNPMNVTSVIVGFGLSIISKKVVSAIFFSSLFISFSYCGIVEYVTTKSFQVEKSLFSKKTFLFGKCLSMFFAKHIALSSLTQV